MAVALIRRRTASSALPSSPPPPPPPPPDSLLTPISCFLEITATYVEVYASSCLVTMVIIRKVICVISYIAIARQLCCLLSAVD